MVFGANRSRLLIGEASVPVWTVHAAGFEGESRESKNGGLLAILNQEVIQY